MDIVYTDFFIINNKRESNLLRTYNKQTKYKHCPRVIVYTSFVIVKIKHKSNLLKTYN